MPLSRYRYIAVDGPIGAGKTSLARKLAERLDGEPLLERPGENPFLPRFYEDMARYALPTQLFFLFQRVAQLRELAQPGLFGGVTVADFLLEKDPLFAQHTLSGDELALYQRIYDALRPQAPRPDLVIYLHADLDTLYERMRKRAVEYEAPLGREYLAALAEAYARFFYHYSGAPLLVVNSERLNFVDNPADLELLIQHIASMRGAREFVNLGG
ncbi:MAG: deoxynucleoside kinase [Burkholderiales bacterium]|nr:deoxynucleoside kinase [Burkholderiales bacterium]